MTINCYRKQIKPVIATFTTNFFKICSKQRFRKMLQIIDTGVGNVKIQKFEKKVYTFIVAVKAIITGKCKSARLRHCTWWTWIFSAWKATKGKNKFLLSLKNVGKVVFRSYFAYMVAKRSLWLEAFLEKKAKFNSLI